MLSHLVEQGKYNKFRSKIRRGSVNIGMKTETDQFGLYQGNQSKKVLVDGGSGNLMNEIKRFSNLVLSSQTYYIEFIKL